MMATDCIYGPRRRDLFFINAMRNNRTIKFSITVCYNVLLSECTQIRTISISNDDYSVDLVLTLKYSKQSRVCKYNYMPLPLGAKSISVFLLYFVDKRFDIYSLKIVAEEVVSVGCFIKIKFRWNWNGVSSFLHQYIYKLWETWMSFYILQQRSAWQHCRSPILCTALNPVAMFWQVPLALNTASSGSSWLVYIHRVHKSLGKLDLVLDAVNLVAIRTAVELFGKNLWEWYTTHFHASLTDGNGCWSATK